MSELSHLRLFGVRENNLKNLDISLPHDRFIVISGVSGSGKSTLAFDTIYAEGGRRYIETFSPYTRQFLDRLKQPELDGVTGVRPALALEQRNRTTSSRSTVGTITEINDYLKILWPQIADPFCPQCGTKVQRHRPVTIVNHLSALVAGGVGEGSGVEGGTIESSVNKSGSVQQKKAAVSLAIEAVLLTFAVQVTGESSLESLAVLLQSEGFLRFYNETTGAVERLDAAPLQPDVVHNGRLLVVTDRLQRSSFEPLWADSPDEDCRQELASRIAQTLAFGHGAMQVVLLAAPSGNVSVGDGESEGAQPVILPFSEELLCAPCGVEIPLPTPAMFSFNSPLGACTRCHGFGRVLEVDPRRCVPDTSKSIEEGAVQCWSTDSTTHLLAALQSACREHGIDTKKPWRALTKAEQGFVFQGDGKKRGYRGVNGWFTTLLGKRHKMHVRVFLARYRGEFECPECSGSRLRAGALLFRVNGKTLPQLWELPVTRLEQFLEEIRGAIVGEGQRIAFSEILGRVRYLREIGLPYLTLDRQTKTLSGGESQRVNLTSILGSHLVNTTLVLDEPTIGLHPRDTARLIQTLRVLSDRGNTVVVVEHDSEVIRQADEVLDLGPESGKRGGEIVYQGPVAGLLKAPRSLTGKYLSGALQLTGAPGMEAEKRGSKAKQNTTLAHAPQIVIRGATAHNLQDIDVEIPLGCFVTITGVSGSGKTSLIHGCLYENTGGRENPGTVRGIEGLEAVSEVVLIDQSPIGKSPRSNPATYSGAWDLFRDCLAETEAAQALGLNRSSFSFNVDGGRCPDCSGAGYHRVEMQFLADVFVQCETCQGSRFKDAVLGVSFAGKNVRELLELTLDEVFLLKEQFTGEERQRKNLNRACDLLTPLIQLGLGYLKLGQPLSEISGGEAQRIKLASYLTGSEKRRCLFLFDEPTTGLHPHNIVGLLKVFHTLIERGHSVVCIEHNQELILASDWMIDLGPEGGEGGGQVVASGVPRLLAQGQKSETETVRALQAHIGNGGQSVRAPKKSENALEHRDEIRIIGARHHNLKNITVSLPHQKLTVVAGVSGSGKSSLAFDILFQEGQRRYIDSLSPYARQYLTQVTRAEVDRVDAIPPTIAISQKTAPPLGVSTIATTTEVYQFLRLLFCKVGTQHCPEHELPIVGLSPDEIVDQIATSFGSGRLFLFAPVVQGRKGYYNELFQRAARAEIEEARVDGKIIRISPELRLERHKLHWISLLVGSLKNAKGNREMLRAAVDQALLLGEGVIEVAYEDKKSEPKLFSTERVCPKCHRGFRELDPQDFSFRSNRGVCGACGGTGLAEGDEGSEQCPECQGTRLGAVGRNVFVDGKNIAQFTEYTAPELLTVLETVTFDTRLEPIVQPILRELKHRLAVISEVGLSYLQLGRDSSTLSGGEAQRLRFARALGSPLSGVCYVLDEPTIGLHPSDHEQLMEILLRLRDAGNTVVVVEHDEETILRADYVIEIGPVGGSGGGRLVVSGSVEELLATPNSVTGAELRARLEGKEEPARGKPFDPEREAIQLVGATANNLKNVSATFPIQQLTVVCGVSGAGKSSLVHQTLNPAMVEALTGEVEGERTWRELRNHEGFDRLIEIDQSPVGKTATSTPASYLGIFDEIRKLFAMMPEARSRGVTPSYFSFNSGKGKCSGCGGRGENKIPMSFLPDATTVCEQCRGMRYDEAALSVLYQGLSIGEVLKRTMSDAKEIFANHKKIRRLLTYVDDLGIGYLTLGQPTHTLSGGEVQRLKIARELGAREAVNTLYILDEPTIGLHMVDVGRLRGVIGKLIEKGNTVVMIEHNLDIIRSADYLIEVGPGPGERGGEVVFEGTPSELVRSKRGTATKVALLKGLTAPEWGVYSKRRKGNQKG